MTKLRVDLKNGFLEVEGEEDFVKGIYADYKEVLTLAIVRQPESKRVPELETPAPGEIEVPNTKDTAAQKPHTLKPKGRSRESHKIIGELNFSPIGKPSLREFVTSKNPGDKAAEMNVIAVYYLQKILEVGNITPDHVYTVYKHVERKVPTALYQSLKDTRNRKGWLDMSDVNNVRVTIGGENFVEHDLPQTEKEEVSP